MFLCSYSLYVPKYLVALNKYKIKFKNRFESVLKKKKKKKRIWIWLRKNLESYTSFFYCLFYSREQVCTILHVHLFSYTYSTFVSCNFIWRILIYLLKKNKTKQKKTINQPVFGDREYFIQDHSWNLIILLFVLSSYKRHEPL